MESNEDNRPLKRKCDDCRNEYRPDQRNLKRGWGLTCSKSCAASMREKKKPGYDPKRVAANNVRREVWSQSVEDVEERNSSVHDGLGNWDPGDDEYWNQKEF